MGLGTGALLLLLLFSGRTQSSFASSAQTELIPPAKVTSIASDRVEIDVTCGSITSINPTDDSFSTFIVTLPGFDQDCTPFGPCLPVKGMAVGIPEDSKPVIKIIEQKFHDTDLPLSLASHPGKSEFQYPVEIGNLGYVRDLKVAQVVIHPVLLLPSGRSIRVYDRIRFAVLFGSRQESDRNVLVEEDPFDDMLMSMLVNPEESRHFKVHRTRDANASRLLSSQPEKYKLFVEREGIYRVTGLELKNAGMDIGSVNPRMIHIENLGEPVATYVHGDADGVLNEEDYIEFYGEAPRGDWTFVHLYTLQNVYWLYVGDSLGLPMIDEDGGLVETDPSLLEMPASFDFSVHAEQESWFERLPNDTMLQQDVWFWDMVSASEQGIKDFSLDIPGPDPGSEDTLAIRLGLQGVSHHDRVEPDHHCLVYLNGALAGGSYWDDQHTHTFSSDAEGTGLQGNVLSETENKVTIVMPGDTKAGSDDRILVNWIEVAYKRLYKAKDNYIRFEKPRAGKDGLYQFTIEGFTTPDVSVYKLGKSKIANATVKPVIMFGDTTYEVIFQTRIVSEGVEFVAAAESNKLKVISIEKDEPSGLRSSLNGADIILVVNDSLAEAASEYKTFRESRGYRVVLAKTSDIYDEFNYGLRDAKAIRDFLKYAYMNWTPPAPFTCVLVGDGNADDRDINKRGGNLIPIHLERSMYSGLVASDNWYACIVGDDILPDIALSRLPVSTPEQLTSVIGKLKRYENKSSTGPWRRRLLYVAGSGGGFGAKFRELMEDSVAQVYLPIWAEGRRVYAEHLPGVDPDPDYGGKSELLGFMNEGVSVAQYLGHGGGATWSNPYLLTPQDVPDLENSGKLPVVASFTCFTSVFDEPTMLSLGEALIVEPEKGAIAVIGGTSLGYFWEDKDMALAFNEAMNDDSTTTVGRLYLKTKLDYAFRNYGGYATSMIKCYGLLGDPASRFALPPRKVGVSVSPRSVEKGDSIRVDVTLLSIEEDSVLVSVSDSAGIFDEARIPLTGSTGAAHFLVPSDVKRGMALARVYAWRGQSTFDAIGAAEFTISSPAIFLVETVPEKPGPWDSVYVKAGVSYSAGVDSVRLLWARSRKPDFWDIIAMAPLAGDTFRTTSTIAPQTPDKPVCFKVAAYGADGKEIESKTYSYLVPDRPNLLILSSKDLYLDGKKRVELKARVFNTGGMAVDSCPVLFKSLPDSLDLGEGWASVPAMGFGEASIPWLEQGLIWQVYAEIDPENIIDENNENDNSTVESPTTVVVDRFNISKDSGSGGLVWSPDSNFSCSVPADAVSDSIVLRLQSLPPHILEQPEMRFAGLPAGDSGNVYSLSLADSSDSLPPAKPMSLKIRFDSADSMNIKDLNLLSVYEFDSTSGKWRKCGGDLDSSCMACETGRFRQYALIASKDTRPPQIKVSVKDQAFASGDFVPPRPSISFMLIDENGIDVRKGFTLQLDGEDVEPSEYVYSAEPIDGNEVQLSYCPYLTDGSHSVKIVCWDCSGNSSSAEFTLRVQSEFRIQGLGNYPNPVRSDETVFAFTLTGTADEAELRIYTPSGRLVRSFDRGRWWDLKEIGYHEVVWDLLDESGFTVANGVYFYQVKATSDEKTIKGTGKLAVLR